MTVYSHPELPFTIETTDIGAVKRFVGGLVEPASPTEVLLMVMLDRLSAESQTPKLLEAQDIDLSSPFKDLKQEVMTLQQTIRELVAIVESQRSNSGVSAVNVNTATSAEIEALPHIGETSADRILALREEKPFADLDDLNNRAKLRLSKSAKDDLEALITY